jgi:sulfate transport system ATP-binding protein
MAGLEKPDHGAVAIDGVDVTDVPARKRGVGFCFQHHAPFNHLTVWRNIAFGLEIRRWPKARIRTKVGELLELVRLNGLENRYPGQISGGQRQRMALARALAIEPRVLLLDEPFGSLDTQVRQELRSWLRELHQQIPVTTVLVTHDQEEALEVADQLAVIKDGRLEQVGPPEILYDRPATEFVMSFLGPTTELDGVPVRPHDLVLYAAPEHGAYGATVHGVRHLGFEVRVDFKLDGRAGLSWAQLSRGDANRLHLQAGDRIWVDAVSHEAPVAVLG